MIITEMAFQMLIIQVVLPSADASTDTDKALLVLFATVLVQLVVVVEVSRAETTSRMTLEAVVRRGLLAAEPPVLVLEPRPTEAPPDPDGALVPVDSQGLVAEEGVLVGEDLLVGAAEIAQRQAMRGASVGLEIAPISQHTRAVRMRAVELEVSQQFVQLIERLAVDRKVRVLEFERREVVRVERSLRITAQDHLGQLGLA